MFKQALSLGYTKAKESLSLLIMLSIFSFLSNLISLNVSHSFEPNHEFSTTDILVSLFLTVVGFLIHIGLLCYIRDKIALKDPNLASIFIPRLRYFLRFLLSVFLIWILASLLIIFLIIVSIILGILIPNPVVIQVAPIIAFIIGGGVSIYSIALILQVLNFIILKDCTAREACQIVRKITLKYPGKSLVILTIILFLGALDVGLALIGSKIDNLIIQASYLVLISLASSFLYIIWSYFVMKLCLDLSQKILTPDLQTCKETSL